MPEPFVHRRTILFGDCDPGGVLYTPRASHFVVEAGLEFLGRQLGGAPERKIFDLGIAPPARALSIEFLHPMTWDDELELEVELKEIRVHAMVLTFTGTVAGRRTMSAEITMVCVSKETRKPVAVPAELRRALNS